MRSVWLIAQNDLRLFLKDKGGYVWLFVMPLVFIYLFGTAMTGPDGPPSNPKPSVAIENLDEGNLGAVFTDQLEQEGFRLIESSEADPIRLIRIPADFTSKIQAGEHVDVDFVRKSGSGAQPTAMVEIRITRAILTLTSAIFATVSDSENRDLSESNIREVLSSSRKVPFESSFAGRRPIPAGFQQSVPGYLVMFVLMNLLIFGGLAITQERDNGSLLRLLTNPISHRQLVLGKILGRFFLGTVQIVYLMVVSRLFFGVDYAGNEILILTTMLVFAWGCAASGVFVASVIRSSQAVQGLCTLASIVLAALGGCWWPLEVVPDFARSIGQLFPTAWAMQAMHQLISFGGGFAEIWYELSLIAVFAILASWCAGRFLRVEP